MLETELQMIERHIREGDAIVARQTQLVAELRRGRGHDRLLDEAVRLLGQFKDTLQLHHKHLARYRQEHGPH